jgi:hypothetical protein
VHRYELPSCHVKSWSLCYLFLSIGLRLYVLLLHSYSFGITTFYVMGFRCHCSDLLICWCIPIVPIVDNFYENLFLEWVINVTLRLGYFIDGSPLKYRLNMLKKRLYMSWRNTSYIAKCLCFNFSS